MFFRLLFLLMFSTQCLTKATRFKFQRSLPYEYIYEPFFHNSLGMGKDDCNSKYNVKMYTDVAEAPLIASNGFYYEINAPGHICFYIMDSETKYHRTPDGNILTQKISNENDPEKAKDILLYLKIVIPKVSMSLTYEDLSGKNKVLLSIQTFNSESNWKTVALKVRSAILGKRIKISFASSKSPAEEFLVFLDHSDVGTVNKHARDTELRKSVEALELSTVETVPRSIRVSRDTGTFYYIMHLAVCMLLIYLFYILS